MNDTQLIAEILKRTPFEGEDDARRALVSSLETLGYALPERLVAALEAALPPDCTALLALGLSVRRRHPRVRDEKTDGVSLSPQTLERVQEICRVLGQLLEPALVASLIAELPAELAQAFKGRHIAHPVSAHTQSLANQNPHGDTKLSSARGMTQEREHRTLADSGPQPRKQS